MSDSADERASANRGFFQARIGDGRPLLIFTALVLILCGVFAIFQAATGHFLPHDVQYLGMTAKDLCGLDQCRIVHFMFHDRVSFGGALIRRLPLSLARRVPAPRPPTLGLVALLRQRRRRFRKLPRLPRLRLLRFLARRRHPPHPPLLHLRPVAFLLHAPKTTPYPRALPPLRPRILENSFRHRPRLPSHHRLRPHRRRPDDHDRRLHHRLRSHRSPIHGPLRRRPP